MIKLEGITRHTQNRIRENGEWWNILKVKRSRLHNGRVAALLKARDKEYYMWISISPFPDEFKVVDITAESVPIHNFMR